MYKYLADKCKSFNWKRVGTCTGTAQKDICSLTETNEIKKDKKDLLISLCLIYCPILQGQPQMHSTA